MLMIEAHFLMNTLERRIAGFEHLCDSKVVHAKAAFSLAGTHPGPLPLAADTTPLALSLQEVRAAAVFVRCWAWLYRSVFRSRRLRLFELGAKHRYQSKCPM